MLLFGARRREHELAFLELGDASTPSLLKLAKEEELAESFDGSIYLLVAYIGQLLKSREVCDDLHALFCSLLRIWIERFHDLRLQMDVVKKDPDRRVDVYDVDAESSSFFVPPS